MPITHELQTSEQLERAGIPRAAAVLIAEKLEEAAQSTQESALDRFRVELREESASIRKDIADFRVEIRKDIADLRVEMSGMRADIEKSIRVSQTVLLSAIGLAIAILAAFKFIP